MTYMGSYIYFVGEFFNHSVYGPDGDYVSDPYILKFDTFESYDMSYDGATLETLKSMEEYFNYQSYVSNIPTML